MHTPQTRELRELPANRLLPEKVKDEEKENHGSSEDETDDGNSSHTDCDQDSDISFMNDTDEELDTARIEEEDWI